MNFDPYITLNLIEANRLAEEISDQISELNRRKKEETEEREFHSYQNQQEQDDSLEDDIQLFIDLSFPHATKGRSYFLGNNYIDAFDHTKNALEAYQYFQSAFKFSGIDRYVLAYWLLFFPRIGESFENNTTFPSLYTMIFCTRFLYNEVITTDSPIKVDTQSMLRSQCQYLDNANSLIKYIFEFESGESEGGNSHTLLIGFQGPFAELVNAGPYELEDGLRVEDPNIKNLVFSSNKSYYLIGWFLSSIRPFVASTMDDIDSIDTYPKVIAQLVDQIKLAVSRSEFSDPSPHLFKKRNFNQHLTCMSPEKIVGSFVCKCFKRKFPELCDQDFYDLIEEKSNAVPSSSEDTSARRSKLVESTINAAFKSGLLKSGTKYLSDILAESRLSEDESKVEIVCKGQSIGFIPVNK